MSRPASRRARGCRLALTAAAAAVLAPATPGHAQRGSDVRRLESRVDVRIARGVAVEPGLGVVVPSGLYVRLAALAGPGLTWRDGAARATGHIDLVGRFLLDPLRQSRWAPYGAGGIGARLGPVVGPRVLLVGMLGLEGPPIRDFLPAVEVGLGGGLRVGAALRRAPPRGR